MREFLQVILQRFREDSATLFDAVHVLAERGIDRGSGIVDLSQILFQSAGEEVAALREFLDLEADGGVDAGPPVGEFLQVGLEGGRHLLATLGELAGVVVDGGVDTRACLGELPDVGIEGLRNGVAGSIEAACEVACPGLEHGRRRRDDPRHLLTDADLAVIDHIEQGLAALGVGVGNFARALDERFVDLPRAGLEGGVELLRSGIERFGAGLELADQCLPALGEGAFDALKARFQFGVERTGSPTEQRDHAGRALVEHLGKRAGNVVCALGEAGDPRVEQAGEGFAGGADAIADGVEPRIDRFVDRGAAFVDAVDQRVAGIGDGHRQLCRRGQDAVADRVARGADLVAHGLVGAGDRGPDALRVADDGVAFGAESVDEGTDAHLVLRIGPFEFVHFRVDKRLEFDGARDGAFDAFAHGGDFAPNRLADHQDAVLRDGLRFGEAERDFGHRLRREPHLLRAADHDGEAPEHEHRNDRRDEEYNEIGLCHDLFDAADLPDLGAEQHVADHAGAGQPRDRQESHHPVDGARGAAVQALNEAAEILLTVVVGRGEGAGLGNLARLRRKGSGLGQGRRRRLRNMGCGLGADRIGSGRLCRSGHRLLGTPFPRKLVGSRGDLRFEVFHRGGDVEIAVRTGQVEIERFFQFPGDIAVEILRGRRFPCHAAVTLYSPREAVSPGPSSGAGDSSLWSIRIVVAQPGKGNRQRATCVKV